MICGWKGKSKSGMSALSDKCCIARASSANFFFAAEMPVLESLSPLLLYSSFGLRWLFVLL